MTKQILLMSSSRVHGFEYLEHAKNELKAFFDKNLVKKILFIPFALTNYDSYTKKVADVIEPWGYECEGIHTKHDQKQAVKQAKLIYIGGGNTFLLLSTLYKNDLVNLIRERVLHNGVPYIGSSAGTNVATRTIQTTNDMPIVMPPTFDALNLVPFNINPHYLDADQDNPHQGETRQERIEQFHELNDYPVVGLREGSALLIDGDQIKLVGSYSARLFQKGESPIEIESNSDLSFLNGISKQMELLDEKH